MQPVTNGQIRELKPSEILSVLQTDYVGNTVLTTEGEQGVAPLAEYKVLFGNGYDKYVLTDTKKLTYDKKSHYQLTDYLGNIRSTKVKGQALEITEYHAFGTPFRRFKGEMSSDSYKFGGKEFDRMHGLNWYDFHARQYDPVLARFHTMDPLAEKKPWLTPYHYCSNNPIIRIDPDGKSDYRNEQGETLFKTNDDLSDIVIISSSKLEEFTNKLGIMVAEKKADNKESNKEELHVIGISISDYTNYYNTSDSSLDAGFAIGYDQTYNNEESSFWADLGMIVQGVTDEGAKIHVGYNKGKDVGASDRTAGKMNRLNPWNSLKSNTPLIQFTPLNIYLPSKK